MTQDIKRAGKHFMRSSVPCCTLSYLARNFFSFFLSQPTPDKMNMGGGGKGEREGCVCGHCELN